MIDASDFICGHDVHTYICPFNILPICHMYSFVGIFISSTCVAVT